MATVGPLLEVNDNVFFLEIMWPQDFGVQVKTAPYRTMGSQVERRAMGRANRHNYWKAFVS